MRWSFRRIEFSLACFNAALSYFCCRLLRPALRRPPDDRSDVAFSLGDGDGDGHMLDDPAGVVALADTERSRPVGPSRKAVEMSGDIFRKLPSPSDLDFVPTSSSPWR